MTTMVAMLTMLSQSMQSCDLYTYIHVNTMHCFQAEVEQTRDTKRSTVVPSMIMASGPPQCVAQEKHYDPNTLKTDLALPG